MKMLVTGRAGFNLRDWLYVEDHADALLLVVPERRVGVGQRLGTGEDAGK